MKQETLIGYFVDVTQSLQYKTGCVKQGRVVRKVQSNTKGYYILECNKEYVIVAEEYIRWNLTDALELLKFYITQEGE